MTANRSTRDPVTPTRGVTAAVTCAVLLSMFAAPTLAAKRAPEAPASRLRDLGREFEIARFLSSEPKLEALDRLEPSVSSVLQNGTADERAAARFLAGEIRFERGDYRGAAEAFGRASSELGSGAFAADADFARIEALEAAGNDAEADKEWARWEKRFPQSSLKAEARLRSVWNAVRRGDAEESGKRMKALVATYPWTTSDARFSLARATVAYLQGDADVALAALGPKPAGAPATYLRALCLARKGDRLKAAALLQDVAERNPDSPLRDPALLAKANTFLATGDFRSAAEEFDRVVRRARDPRIKAEAELRAAGALFLTGAKDSAFTILQGVVERNSGNDIAARGQFLLGEALLARGQYAEAIVQYNRVLTSYFQHSVAASAQYRVGRCLDALGRRADATGTYQAVVKGYPLEPEAPAAAYLAGIGLIAQGKPLTAAPYFQLVLDRYASRRDSSGFVVFASPEHRELVESALCLLEYAYHKSGDLGQLSGAPHLLLQRMPPSRSPWRAYAMLIDADAMAAQARYPEAQATLEQLVRDHPDNAVGTAAARLMAWTYSRQGKDSLAIATEERLLARGAVHGTPEVISGAMLDIAHARFNQRRYKEAVGAYEEFLRRFPAHPRRFVALYHSGLCYLRLDRAGDAVDRWEAMLRDSATAPLAERAWARAGDVYFQAERYEEAKRCYRGLLEHFAGSSAASLASLRLAQCDYNAGRDADALQGFSQTAQQYPGTPAAREAEIGTERALYRLSQTAKGSQTLAQLVEQYPGSAFAADALFQIAKRAYQEKRYVEAADGFRRVVSQFPGYSGADQAQFLLADAYAQDGKREEALRAYEQFVGFFPQSELSAMVSFRLGLLQFEGQNPMQAAVAFTRVLEESTTTEVRSASLYNLALCNRLLGDHAAAKTGLERYQTEFPGDSRADDVQYQLGDLEEAAGQFPPAIEHYQKALAASPKASLAVELHFRLGRCREQVGEAAAALRSYQQASAHGDKANPYRLSAVARLAALYEANRDYPRAVTAYRDIARHSKDQELVSAAAGRASQLEALSARR
jgi:TolA-binding protein